MPSKTTRPLSRDARLQHQRHLEVLATDMHIGRRPHRRHIRPARCVRARRWGVALTE